MRLRRFYADTDALLQFIRATYGGFDSDMEPAPVSTPMLVKPAQRLRKLVKRLASTYVVRHVACSVLPPPCSRIFSQIDNMEIDQVYRQVMGETPKLDATIESLFKPGQTITVTVRRARSD